MPITADNTQGEVSNFTRVKTGDMSELRPNIKAGKYRGTFEVTPKKTKATGHPMFEIKVTVEESLNEDAALEGEIGRTSNVYLVFGPSDGKGANMQHRLAKNLTEGFELPPLDTSGFDEGGDGWETTRPWVEALEDGSKEFWVTNEPDRTTGEPQTNVHALDPGKAGQKPSSSGAELDDEPAPATRAGGKSAPAKGNGTKAGHGGKGRR
jgi:hypothetical protein